LARKRIPLEDKITANGKIYGRPIEWTDERIEDLADKLLFWCRQDDSIMLTKFCADNEIIASELSHFEENNNKFAKALKLAKLNIAARREQMVNEEKMNYGVYQRYQAMYDPLIHKHERAEKAYEAELKKQIVAGANGNVTLNITDYGKS
tara:strand:+ start:251 stop:700 length:450 start_codon:yes stop_codon:yes gene_type:complete